MTIHNHNTRGHNKIHANVVIQFAKRCLRYNIIKTVNNSPSSVINKITTHSMGGFITYIKAQLLQKYDGQCMLFKYCGIIGLLLNIPITICITVIPPLPPHPSPPSLSPHPPSLLHPPSLPHIPSPPSLRPLPTLSPPSSLPSLQQIHCPFQPKQSPS